MGRGRKSEIWEDRCNNLKQSIWKAAELVGLVRKESNGNLKKTGFDKECAEQRSKVWECLKDLRKKRRRK